jgi:hypothetical protein
MDTISLTSSPLVSPAIHTFTIGSSFTKSHHSVLPSVLAHPSTVSLPSTGSANLDDNKSDRSSSHKRHHGHLARLGSSSDSIVLLEDLKTALHNSDIGDCWSDMAGVLLWIGLTAGAASARHKAKVLRNWFVALVMRTSMVLCFEHPEAIHAAYLRMANIVEALSDGGRSRFELHDTKGADMPAKRRRAN